MGSNREDQIKVFAPGRVNLMGDHTDTSGGLALPCALDLGLSLEAFISDGPTSVFSEGFEWDSFDAGSAEPGQVSGAAAYAAGVAWVLRQMGFGAQPNLRGFLHSTLPAGSGLSSSAALTVAIAMAWNELGGLALEPMEIARIAQRAENEFVGMPCGLMDPWVISCAKQDHALFCDFQNEVAELVPLPRELKIVIAHTGTHRKLAADGQYAARVQEVQEATALLGLNQLREACVEDIKKLDNKILQKRVRHVVTENERVRQTREALQQSDWSALSRLFQESHESLRDDFKASSPELDAMAEACWQAPGVVGARMTGAGWGGACVALVQKQDLESFLASAESTYRLRTSIEPRIWVSESAHGARKVNE